MINFLTNWIDNLFQSFFNEDLTTLTKLIDPKLPEEKFEEKYLNVTKLSDFNNIVQDNLRIKLKDEKKFKNFNEFISNYFLFRINYHREEFHLAFENLKDSFINFQDIYKNLECPKFLNFILRYFMRKLLISSSLADQKNLKKKINTNTQYVNELGRYLMNFFSKFQLQEDKQIIFFSIICIIRIYFKLRTYRNSKTLVEWVDLGNINYSLLPKSDVVTYFYYSGRLGLYELKLSEARKIFSNAFEICDISQKNNLKLILEYLIPLNLFFGKIPEKDLLKKYDVYEYCDLIDSYKIGDMRKFEEALDQLENRLIQLGTFLIVDKLRGFVFRNLIRKVYKIFEKEISERKNPIMHIELIYKVLKNVYNYDNYDMEELELYLNSVIFKGLIGGYIHTKDKVIVFSKKNPFPNLAEVLEKNYNKII